MIRLGECQSCGRRTSYWNAFYLKNKKSYECPSCGSKALVKIKKELRAVRDFVLVFGALIVGMSVVFGYEVVLWLMAAQVMIFLGFYALSPFFIVFIPPVSGWLHKSATRARAPRISSKGNVRI